MGRRLAYLAQRYVAVCLVMDAGRMFATGRFDTSTAGVFPPLALHAWSAWACRDAMS